MNTTFEKEINGQLKSKESKLRLMKVYTKDELEYLGEATIDLEEYVDCIDRKQFVVRLNDSQFADASVEFYVTATQILEKKPVSNKNMPTV